MKVLSSGFNTFNYTGKYTYATVEYAGLLSYSMVKRGGILVTCGVRKVTMPVAAAVCWPYDFIKKGTGSLFGGKKYEERITGLTEKLALLEEGLIKKEHEKRIESLTEKLALIEERLAKIEKYGVIAGPEEHVLRKRKELTEDKRFVLKGILEETKALKDMG